MSTQHPAASQRSDSRHRKKSKLSNVGAVTRLDTGTDEGPRAATIPANTVGTPATPVIFGTGRFQGMVLFCAQLAVFISLVHQLVLFIMARPIDHWCKQPDENASLSAMEWKNASIPRDSSGAYKRCTRYNLTAPPSENGTEIPCDSWDYDEQSGGKHRSIIGEFGLVCNRSSKFHLLAVTYVVGGALALPFAGIAADHLGRRPILLVSLFVLLVSGFMTAVAKTLTVFGVARFFLSASLSSFQVMATVLLFEVAPKSYRTLYCILALSLPMTLIPFFLMMALLLHPDWAFLQLLVMFPTSFLVASVYLTDESPIWLMSSCNFNEASRVILWAAKTNELNLDTVRADLQSMRQDVVSRQGFVSRPSIAQLMLSKHIRFRSLVIFGTWCVLFSSTTVLNLTTQKPSTLQTHVIVMLANIPVMVATFYIVKKWGCRVTLMASMFAISTLLIVAAAMSSQGHHVIYYLAVVVPLHNIAAIGLFAYTIELFPSAIRCFSLSTANMFGTLGGIIAPIISHYFFGDSRSQAELQFAATGLCMVLFAMLIGGLPETSTTRPSDTLREMLLEDNWNVQTHSKETRGESLNEDGYRE